MNFPIVASYRSRDGVATSPRQVVDLSASEVSFTALRRDGAVVRWGHPHYTRSGASCVRGVRVPGLFVASSCGSASGRPNETSKVAKVDLD